VKKLEKTVQKYNNFAAQKLDKEGFDHLIDKEK
jgi:hypothetical protein